MTDSRAPRFTPGPWLLAGLILVAALSRVLPHPPNFSPVEAIALFGGAYFASRRMALLVPLLAMFASDMALGALHGGIYRDYFLGAGFWLVYACIALSTLLGFRMRGRVTGGRVLGYSLAGSVLFFDCNLMHGSASNISPMPRRNLFMVYNSVENALVEPFSAPQRRPEHIASRRFAPVYVKLKELLAADTPHSAHIKMNRGELLKPEWTGDVSVTGGFLYETTIHLLDMVRFQFGEIGELVAYGSKHEYPELDEFSVLFKLRNGFHCTFASSSDASWHFPFERVEVFCHHRTIMTEEMERLHDSRGTDADFETYSFHMTEKDERWGYVQEDTAFIDAILNASRPLVTADDGFRAVELVEAVYEAVRKGEKVGFEAAKTAG